MLCIPQNDKFSTHLTKDSTPRELLLVIFAVAGANNSISYSSNQVSNPVCLPSEKVPTRYHLLCSALFIPHVATLMFHTQLVWSC